MLNQLGWELCFGEHKIPMEQSIEIKDVRAAIERLHLPQLVPPTQEAHPLVDVRVDTVIQAYSSEEEWDLGNARNWRSELKPLPRRVKRHGPFIVDI